MSSYYNYGFNLKNLVIQQNTENSTVASSEHLNGTETRSVSPNNLLSSSDKPSESCWRSVDSILNDSPSSSSFSSFHSSSSTTLSHSNGTIIENSQTMSNSTEKLTEDTERREKAQCLNIQIEAITNLKMIVDESVDFFSDTVQKLKTEHDGIIEEEEVSWKKINKFMDDLEETKVNEKEEIEKRSERLSDTVNQALSCFTIKEDIECFVRRYEDFYDSSQIVMEIISENQERIHCIRQLLRDSKTEKYGISEKEITREEKFYFDLLKMIRDLPLNSKENGSMRCAIANIERDPTLKIQTKCQMIIRNLFNIMSAWNINIKSTVTKSSIDNWNCFDSLKNWSEDSKSSSIPFDSSSLSTDSNLNDLDGVLRTARIRKAVEGPNRVYECSPWDTAFDYSGTSSETNDFSRCQSLETELLSVSKESQKTVEKIDNDHSSHNPVIPLGFNHQKTSQSLEKGNHSSCVNSLNFSNVSLGEMAEEALYTAKDVAETQAIHLIDALQSTTKKCGSVLTDLMTAISSSSETLSSTQSSHHSDYSTIH